MGGGEWEGGHVLLVPPPPFPPPHPWSPVILCTVEFVIEDNIASYNSFSLWVLWAPYHCAVRRWEAVTKTFAAVKCEEIS